MKNILKNKIESIFLVKIKKKIFGIVRKKKLKKDIIFIWLLTKSLKNEDMEKIC